MARTTRVQRVIWTDVSENIMPISSMDTHQNVARYNLCSALSVTLP